MRPILLIVALFAAGCGKDKAEPAPTTSAPAAAVSEQQPPAMQDSEETVSVVQLLWPHAKKADAADFRWAGCSDRTVGYDESRACLEGALKEVEAVKSKMPEKLRVQTPCGIETDKAHRAFIDGRIAYLRDDLAWFDKNAATLKRLMVSKSRWDAVSAMGKAGENRPIGISEKYSGGLLVITQLPCLKVILRCPSPGCTSDQLNSAAGLPR